MKVLEKRIENEKQEIQEKTLQETEKNVGIPKKRAHNQ